MTGDLDPAHVELELSRLGASLGRPLSVVAMTASTNDDAKAAASAEAPHGATFIADAQTAGRGRGGHTWHSPPGDNLYMSVVLRPRLDAASIAPIALVVGVAAASAIERTAARSASGGASIEVGIKWPNDLFAGRRKLGGVLVEGRLRGAEVASLVIGVGINVRTQSFPEAIADRATSLRALGFPDVDRGSLAASLLASIGASIDLFERRGLTPFVSELAARDVLRGARVDVSGVRGVAEGIDEGGRLLVRADDGVIYRQSSGEVITAPRA